MIQTASRLVIVAVVLAVGPALPGEAWPQARQERQGAGRSPVPPEAAREFQQRLDAYRALRSRAAKTLAPLPDRATPEQITANQRRLSATIRQSRAGAAPGDVFTPAIAQYIRGVLGELFEGPVGAKRLASIMDVHPVVPPVSVNGRYPSEVPLSTMPPDVLAALPRLEDDLEFRFVGDDLILLDTQADLVVDLMEDVLPRRPWRRPEP